MFLYKDILRLYEPVRLFACILDVLLGGVVRLFVICLAAQCCYLIFRVPCLMDRLS